MKYISLILVFCIFIISCEKQTDISNPLKYEKDGVNFTYPKNWKITENKRKDNLRIIFIENPDDAILTIQIYSKKEALSLNEFVKWYSEELRKLSPNEYKQESTFSPISAKNNNKPIKGIRERTLTLRSKMTIPFTSEYYKISNPEKTAFLITHVASEDLRKVKLGFELLIRSFSIK